MMDNILKYLILIPLVIILLLVLFIGIYYHDVPCKTDSIMEYNNHLSLLNDRGTIKICIKTATSVTVAPTGALAVPVIPVTTSHCVEELIINNKQELIEYINNKYKTDILNEIEDYNKQVKEYLEKYKNSKNKEQ